MIERTTRAQREAMVVGDHAGVLTADEAADVGLLVDVLAHPSTWAEPSARLEEAVVHAVMNLGTGDAPPAPQVPRRARHRRVVVWSARAAAALLVIALAAGVALALKRGETRDFHADLAASGLATDAHGTLDITHTSGGFRIKLDAPDLRPLPNGGYYEAWLTSASGIVVPIGTFSSGDEYVTLWSGVSPADFPHVAITIEAPDNNQMSSGRIVLVGDVVAG